METWPVLLYVDRKSSGGRAKSKTRAGGQVNPKRKVDLACGSVKGRTEHTHRRPTQCYGSVFYCCRRAQADWDGSLSPPCHRAAALSSARCLVHQSWQRWRCNSRRPHSAKLWWRWVALPGLAPVAALLPTVVLHEDRQGQVLMIQCLVNEGNLYYFIRNGTYLPIWKFLKISCRLDRMQVTQTLFYLKDIYLHQVRPCPVISKEVTIDQKGAACNPNSYICNNNSFSKICILLKTKTTI
jgi:hypothetical protein